MKKNFYLTDYFFCFSNFLENYPALCVGCFFAVGISFFLSSNFLVFLFVLPFWISSYKKKRFLLFSFLMLLFGYGYCYFRNVSFEKPIISGQGYFVVEKYMPSSFSKKILCIGRMKSFTSQDGKKYRNLPVCTSCKSSQRMKGNLTYLLQGELIKKEFSYFMKKYQLIEKKRRFSLIELRYLIKKKAKSFFYRVLSNSNSKKLISGLVTGDFHDQFIRFSFSRLGISHVMAISGLHFSLLIALVFFLLRLFIPLRYVNYILVFLATLYFLFIGPSASIQRAWIMIMCFLIAQIVSKNYQPINSLGLAFLISLLIDPNMIKNLGFQLSFLSVMAILLYFPAFQPFVNKAFPVRSKEEIVSLSYFSKISYFFLRYIVNGFSLSLCVSIIILPVLLYHFHSFPLLSLFYNLFMPLFIGIILLFSFSLLLCHLLFPFLTVFFAKILDVFASFVVNYALFSPPLLDIQFRMKYFSFSLTIIFLFFQMIILLPLIHRREKDSLSLAFI